MDSTAQTPAITTGGIATVRSSGPSTAASQREQTASHPGHLRGGASSAMRLEEYRGPCGVAHAPSVSIFAFYIRGPPASFLARERAGPLLGIPPPPAGTTAAPFPTVQTTETKSTTVTPECSPHSPISALRNGDSKISHPYVCNVLSDRLSNAQNWHVVELGKRDGPPRAQDPNCSSTLAAHLRHSSLQHFPYIHNPKKCRLQKVVLTLSVITSILCIGMALTLIIVIHNPSLSTLPVVAALVFLYLSFLLKKRSSKALAAGCLAAAACSTLFSSLIVFASIDDLKHTLLFYPLDTPKPFTPFHHSPSPPSTATTTAATSPPPPTRLENTTAALPESSTLASSGGDRLSPHVLPAYCLLRERPVASNSAGSNNPTPFSASSGSILHPHRVPGGSVEGLPAVGHCTAISLSLAILYFSAAFFSASMVIASGCLLIHGMHGGPLPPSHRCACRVSSATLQHQPLQGSMQHQHTASCLSSGYRVDTEFSIAATKDA